LKKQNLVFLILGLVSMGLAGGAEAASPEPVSIGDRISSILVRFPAPGPAAKISLAAEVFELGEAGIEEICRRLAAPGAADDSLARYALDAAGTYAMRPGGEKDRLAYTRAVIKTLQGRLDPEVKTFLIERLEQAGGPECLDPLGRLLTDRKLADPALRALLAVRAPGTAKVLLGALGRPAASNPAPLLHALGELRSREAVGRIIPFTAHQDAGVRDAALFALAALGDTRTEFFLSRVGIASSPRERAAAAARYLLFAERLFENGRKTESRRTCRSLLEKNTGPEESHVRSAALALLYKIERQDSLPALIEAMDSPNPAFRAAALDLADGIPGEEATALWVAKARRVFPEARDEIIRMLGRRGDRTALDFVKENLAAGDGAVRTAAIEAAGRLAGDEILNSLSPLWRTADDEEAAALKTAYLGLPAEKSVAGAAGAYAAASPSSKAAILEILAERRSKDHAGLVLAAAESEEEAVRKQALAALGAVVSGEHVFRVIGLLQASEDPTEVGYLQNALAAAAGQAAGEETGAGLVIEAMQKAGGRKRINLLRPLYRIGGEAALQAVLAETQSVDPQVRAVAIYVLANWPEDRAAGDLLRIAKSEGSSPGGKFLYLALQGYIRLITESTRTPEQKLASIKEGMAITRGNPETNLVLNGLGSIRSVESLEHIAPFLEDPVFRDKAAWSALSCALPAPGFEGLTGLVTARVLKRAAQFIGTDYDRGQAEQRAGELLLKEGFVPLFNGKDLSGWKGLVKDPPSRSRMSPDELKKEQKAADESMRRHWRVVDGTLFFDGRGESLCSADDFADFELFVDWKIESGGDSGIYLRGSPQVQIWDPAQWPEGSGGLYNNKTGPAKPLLPADNAVGEWNTFFIRMSGDRVTVHLNGRLVVDDAVMENYWERDKPIYPRGQIELQAHNTPLYFRNIYIRKSAE
jgi:HEAT repeat protein